MSESEITDMSPIRRKSLEHVCGVCGQRLSVKFNFEGLDDDNDDRWLELDCISCNIKKIEAREKSARNTSHDVPDDGDDAEELKQ